MLKPTGTVGVGTVVTELKDSGRTSNLASDSMGRALKIQIWYPSNARSDATQPLIWEQLRRNPDTPLPVRLLLGCILVCTTAVVGASIRASQSRFPLVIYNHGMVSFTDENTSLMEDLASHGFVVLSVQHAEQMMELRALNRARSVETGKRDAVLIRQIRQASRNERSRLALEYYRNSVNTNRIVIERARDTSFVLRHAKALVEDIPGISSGQVDTDAAHFVGYSVGGAVSAEAANDNATALSVVNIDGGLQGSLNAQAVCAPFLMMYSDANDGINDQLLPPQAQKVTIPGTTHLNFHDVSMLMPFLRYFGATGKARPEVCLAHRNQAVSNFISACQGIAK